VFETLATLVQPWADLYANQPRFATGLIAIHILAMFLGGGMAIAADRAILRSAPGTANAARAVVADLSATHALVVSALIVSSLSGIALFLTDVPTFAASTVYWSKMGTLLLLVLNGIRLRRAEQAVIASLDGAPIQTAELPVPFPVSSWGRVRQSAGLSFALWVSLVLLGVLLTNG
jgi:hypothetical protein